MKNNHKIFIITSTITLLILFSSCITSSPIVEPDTKTGEEKSEKEPEPTPRAVTARKTRFSEKAITGAADMYAEFNTPGGKVLAVAADLVEKKELILGGCWTYVNAVYDKAGFPAKKRETLYNVDQNGPYIDHSLILPGDWIMYRNLPYNEIGHSAIFVEWIDFERRSALTIEYVGGNRKIPGRYREADILKTFGLLRGME